MDLSVGRARGTPTFFPSCRQTAVVLAVVPVPPSGETTAAYCWAVRNLTRGWYCLKHGFRAFFNIII